jgi:hypothetical protein
MSTMEEYSFGHSMHTAKLTLCNHNRSRKGRLAQGLPCAPTPLTLTLCNLFETFNYHHVIHVAFVFCLLCLLCIHNYSFFHTIRKKECIQPIYVHTLTVCNQYYLFSMVSSVLKVVMLMKWKKSLIYNLRIHKHIHSGILTHLLVHENGVLQLSPV